MTGVAFLVGIETYDDEHFMPLTTGYDVDAIAEKLESKNSRYKLIKDPLKGTVTREELERELTSFLSEQRGDALIYFSGHGYQVDTGETGEKKYRGYLATSNCKLSVIDKQIVGQHLGLPLSTLNDLIHESSLNSIVLLLDACHSGRFLEEAIVKTSFQAKTTLNYHIIASSLSSQSSYMDDKTEDENEGLSVFTDALLKGLLKSNADANGKITSDKLFRSIEERLGNNKYKQQPIQMALYRNSIVLMEYELSANLTTATATTLPIDPILDKKTGEILCPYQGLKTFDEEQKLFFFGRERLVEALREELKQIAFIPVIGASGSGKSSVVRAGLIPLLREEGWHVLKPIKPDRRPLRQLKNLILSEEFSQHIGDEQLLDDFDDNPNSETLEAILRQLQGSKRFLLLVDQFEELFTLNSEENQRNRLKNDGVQFIDLITRVARVLDSPLAVVITMRADFIERCLHYPVLHDLIQNHAVFMPPLVGEDLLDVIEKPAQYQGYQVEAALVADLAAEVRKEPGSLPLLEFALTQLWEQRDEQRKMLTYEAYTTLGGETSDYKETSGLKRALNLHANRVHDAWVDAKKNKPREDYEKDWIRRVFLRLVRTGQGKTDTRQRQPKASLLTIAGTDQQGQQELALLIDDLVKGRLLVTGEADMGQLEQSDKQLSNEELKKLAQENQIIDLAHEALIDGWQKFVEWRQNARDLRRLSERLEDALREWLKDPQDENLMMGGLLAEVREKWEKLQPYLQSPEDEDFFRLSDSYEKNRIAQLKLEKAGINSLRQFESGREIEGLLTAIKNGEELKNLVEDRPLKFYPTFSPVRALQQMLYKSFDGNRFRECNHLEHLSVVYGVNFSPNGQLIATALQEHTEGPTGQLWNYYGKRLVELQGHKKTVRYVSFSPLELLIATASDDGTAKLWNYSGEPVGELSGHKGPVKSVNFSPLEPLIATASDDGTAKLWDYKGNLVRKLAGHKAGVNTISFCRNEPLIITASQDGIARISNYSGKLVQELPGHRGELVDASFSPDGQLVVTASKDGTIRLWNRLWQVLQEFRGHVEAPYCVSFSPDGQFLAAGWEIRARLWKRSAGSIQELPSNPPQAVNQARISPKGNLIATALSDGVVKLWDSSGELLQSLPGHGYVTSICYTDDGQFITVVSQNGLIKLWDITGELIQEFYVSGSPIWGADITSKGDLLVTASNDGKVRLWDQTGKLIQEFSESSAALASVKFSPNEQEIVAISWFGKVQHWQSDSWQDSAQLINSFSAHKERAVDIDFSPCGEFFATASEDRTAKLWNRAGKLVQELGGHQGWATRVSFSPVEDLIATASSDGKLRLWSYTGEIVQELDAFQDWPNSVSFGPDGKTIVIASTNNPARLLKVYNLNELINLGRSWLEGYFNRQKYFS